ncbi:MAG: hypothetical protein FJY75_05665 [Candidatus Eisenbacteria bacterium]|uniref:Uncharacterized protein n=1 Tax=Eiseniibacteriota bacterium TaxID=2212470 RepID=A0A937X8U9_UNCEI|nr:hypothetical protein [Candidatus Eisenbacteria bacterium]
MSPRRDRRRRGSIRREAGPSLGGGGRLVRALAAGLLGMALFQGAPLAANRVVSRELLLVGGYSDREGWSGNGGHDLKNASGIEYLERFSREGGDFLTANLQARIAYDADEPASRAWSLDLHNAWVEHKLGLGRTLRAGHFDAAFGLEPLLDTHATIFQTLAHDNIGYKQDWGIAYSGFAGAYDYTIALQNGSGMSLQRRDGSFLATARIGTPPGRELQYGLSGMAGRVLRAERMRTFPRPPLSSDRAVRKERLGLDAQYEVGPWAFKAETAYGRDDRRPVLGALSQLDYTIPSRQRLQLHLQGMYWDGDLRHDGSGMDHLVAGAGLTHRLDRRWSWRLAWFQPLLHGKGLEDGRFVGQVYCFAS